MIVRQSDAHAWAEAIVDGRWLRFDPTAAVAPSRVEQGLGAALPAGEPVPYLARLEMTWLKSLRLRWDAINYQWQRGVVGFNIERQRDFLREFGLDNPRPVQLVAVMAAWRSRGVWRCWVSPASAVLDPRPKSPVVRVCRRLARAGLARRPTKGLSTTPSAPPRGGRGGACCCVPSVAVTHNCTTVRAANNAKRCWPGCAQVSTRCLGRGCWVRRNAERAWPE